MCILRLCIAACDHCTANVATLGGRSKPERLCAFFFFGVCVCVCGTSQEKKNLYLHFFDNIWQFQYLFLKLLLNQIVRMFSYLFVCWKDFSTIRYSFSRGAQHITGTVSNKATSDMGYWI